jgi:hypothetical protein
MIGGGGRWNVRHRRPLHPQLRYESSGYKSAYKAVDLKQTSPSINNYKQDGIAWTKRSLKAFRSFVSQASEKSLSSDHPVPSFSNSSRMKTRHNRLDPIRPIPGLSQFASPSLSKSSLTFKVKELSRNYPGIGFIRWETIMVLRFILRPNEIPSLPITPDAVETVIARNEPWYQPGENPRDARFFAVCPFCNNVIQLKALYRSTGRQRPYGSHVNEPMPQIAPFRAAALRDCVARAQPALNRDHRRAMSETDRDIIYLLQTQFDRIVLILREDIGVNFSKTAAERLLADFIGERGWLYPGTHARNLPWMLAYLARPIRLFGQYFDMGSDSGRLLMSAIERRAPHARFSPEGQLHSDGTRVSLILQLLHHTRKTENDGEIDESIALRVLDMSATNMPAEAPVCFQARLSFDHERLERLMLVPDHKAKRNAALLEIARRLIPQEIVR